MKSHYELEEFSNYFPPVEYLFEHYSLSYPSANVSFCIAVLLIDRRWQVCSPLPKPAAHSVAKMFTSLETSGKVTGDQEPTCTAFFFMTGLGLCLWLANGWKLLWLEKICQLQGNVLECRLHSTIFADNLKNLSLSAFKKYSHRECLKSY